MCVVFFKQKTAYEMLISDWSSDVCSSDLQDRIGRLFRIGMARHLHRPRDIGAIGIALRLETVIEIIVALGKADPRLAQPQDVDRRVGGVRVWTAADDRRTERPLRPAHEARKSTRLHSSN